MNDERTIRVRIRSSDSGSYVEVVTEWNNRIMLSGEASLLHCMNDADLGRWIKNMLMPSKIL